MSKLEGDVLKKEEVKSEKDKIDPYDVVISRNSNKRSFLSRGNSESKTTTRKKRRKDFEKTTIKGTVNLDTAQIDQQKHQLR